MKLLFDENLSFKLRAKMQDVFPGSKHVRDLGLEQVEDIEIWEFSKNENFVIVTKDADFKVNRV
jgi:predicted nuclease of predicted toxin-antitoxin system